VLAGIGGPPAFSPDGQRVAFVRDTLNVEDSLMTASVDGSGERELASYKRPDGIEGDRVAWSPDGKALAFAHGSGSPQRVVATIGPQGGSAQPVPGAHFDIITNLDWLPGSRDLVVAAFDSGHFQLYEVSLEEVNPGKSLTTSLGTLWFGRARTERHCWSYSSKFFRPFRSLRPARNPKPAK
jgi:Tol biopolymer transport system component